MEKKALLDISTVEEEEVWSDASEQQDIFIQRMEAAGFQVLKPKDNELFIDIDTPGQYAIFQRNIEAWNKNMDQEFRVKCWKEAPSKSGLPRRHITCTLHSSVVLSPRDRICFQALLGSDPMRELLSLCRYHAGDSDPTLFVEQLPKTPEEEE